jgi:hypothetical protein
MPITLIAEQERTKVVLNARLVCRSVSAKTLHCHLIRRTLTTVLIVKNGLKLKLGLKLLVCRLRQCY